MYEQIIRSSAQVCTTKKAICDVVAGQPAKAQICCDHQRPAGHPQNGIATNGRSEHGITERRTANLKSPAQDLALLEGATKEDQGQSFGTPAGQVCRAVTTKHEAVWHAYDLREGRRMPDERPQRCLVDALHHATAQEPVTARQIVSRRAGQAYTPRP
jgi:hypothetical protein